MLSCLGRVTVTTDFVTLHAAFVEISSAYRQLSVAMNFAFYVFFSFLEGFVTTLYRILYKYVNIFALGALPTASFSPSLPFSCSWALTSTGLHADSSAHLLALWFPAFVLLFMGGVRGGVEAGGGGCDDHVSWNFSTSLLSLPSLHAGISPSSNPPVLLCFHFSSPCCRLRACAHGSTAPSADSALVEWTTTARGSTTAWAAATTGAFSPSSCSSWPTHSASCPSRSFLSWRSSLRR